LRPVACKPHLQQSNSLNYASIWLGGIPNNPATFGLGIAALG